MTAKQKANNLIDSYYVLLDGFVTFEQVKICALIAVDELIEATSMRYEFRNGEIVEAGRKPLQYWLDVKNEIENL